MPTLTRDHQRGAPLVILDIKVDINVCHLSILHLAPAYIVANIIHHKSITIFDQHNLERVAYTLGSKNCLPFLSMWLIIDPRLCSWKKLRHIENCFALYAIIMML
jgi:hypothetical protein